MSAILRRSESDLQKALIHCDLDNRSPRNGLCAVHFAVVWPTALRSLISAGADIDVQDNVKRRPIQLAVALGNVESVTLLMEADCCLSTSYPHPGLLKEGLQLKEQDLREQISTLIVQGMINRHTRLLSWTSALRPPSSQLVNLIVPGKLQQSLVPMIMEEMSCLGHEIPTALKLDDKSHYETGDINGMIRLPVSTAEQLWDGGFQELETPYYVNFPKLTLVLQAWRSADFDFLRWLISKGASPFSKHPLTGRSGLHWFARRLRDPWPLLSTSHVSSDMGLVSQLKRDNSAWRDSCSCLCSIGGCQPVTIFLKNHDASYGRVCLQFEGFSETLDALRDFWVKIPPPPQQTLAQAEAVLRFFAFHQTNAQHVASCCRFDDDVIDSEKIRRAHPRWREAGVSNQEPTFLHDFEMIERKMEHYRKKLRFCGCLHLKILLCVIFRDTCPNAKRRQVRIRTRHGRSIGIRFPWDK